MEQDLATVFSILKWTVLGGFVLFVVRVFLVFWLKGRVSAALKPNLTDLHHPDSTTQFLSLLGHRARPMETMGTYRLRATIGLQLAHWGVSLLIAIAHNTMNAPILGFESLLLVLVLLMSLQTSLYEVEFNRQTVSLPRWWFGRTTHKWADLLALGAGDRWFMTFSFDKGPAVRVHKYIVGHDLLVDAARKAMRES